MRCEDVDEPDPFSLYQVDNEHVPRRLMGISPTQYVLSLFLAGWY